jgi:hypothetical protein
MQQQEQPGQQEPNPASAKEKVEDAKKSNKSDNPPELDGKNDSGVEPEIHGHELPGE